MRVLVVVRWPVGGIRTFLTYLYDQPCFSDCELTIVMPSEGADGPAPAGLGCRSVRIETIAGGPLSMMRAVSRLLAREKFEVVHSQGLTAGLLTQLARKGNPRPHIVSVHDMFLPGMFSGVKGRAKLWGMNRLLAGVSAVHCVSEDCSSNFSEYVPAVRRDRVRAIVHGIPTATFSGSAPSDLRTRLGECGRDRVIGFFGRFLAPKGFRDLVDAVGLIRDRFEYEPFVVATFGWGGFIREDYEYLASKGLADFFVQQPHSDEPAREMRAVDLIAMPSRWEASGLVAMEALVAGVPVVGTDCVGLREVLRGTPARVVPTGDAHELAAAIHAELAQPRRADFEDYATEAARRFDIGRCAAEVRSLYDEVALAA